MNQILVGLYVPTLQERFDLFLPLDMRIAALTDLLSEGVRELSGGRYIPSRHEMLSTQNPDVLLRPDKALRDYGAEDGTQLVLI